ncbi:MAG: phosphatase [Clostridia bacterium]|nr:phosphatase [Clostridia bacterium]
MEKTLKEAIAEARKSYFKKWRVKNKDKIKEANERYWMKKALEKLKEEGNSDGESKDNI